MMRYILSRDLKNIKIYNKISISIYYDILYDTLCDIGRMCYARRRSRASMRAYEKIPGTNSRCVIRFRVMK